MYKLPSSLLLIVILVMTQVVYSQGIETALNNYNNKAPQEKLYVQFDNTKYAPGQIVWYKAYLMNGFQPSLLSKNFYIDWYDENGTLISSTVSPIITNFSTGNFKVPENYNSHLIHSVAYTKWMLNFDTAFFFNQNIQIVTDNTTTIQSNSVVNESSIQLLPESGNFIAGKLNVIAFKAINSWGLPENINGIIQNEKGDSVTIFKAVHDGMGKVQFIPNKDHQYVAIWKDISGILHKTPLPLAQEQGVNLTIEPGRSNRIFHVQRSKEAPSNMQQLTLVGQMNGSILFMAKLNLMDKESITTTLPLSKMLTGILQLTIFDANDKPICERLVFIKNEDYKLNIATTTDTLNNFKRGKNVLKIHLKDTTYANLSLAITDANTNEMKDNNIIAHLLLNSDLAGNVYKPAYYFSSNADSISNYLDLVMLTNGWRKYNWNNILSGQIPNLKYALDNSYQTISGKVLDYNNKKNKKPETINLIFVAKDSSNNMMTLPILEDGTFASNNAMLYDTTKIYFKINGSTAASNKNIVFNNDLYKADPKINLTNFKSIYDTLGFAKLKFIIKEQAKLDSINKHYSLKDVTVFSKQKARIKELDKKYTFGVFSGEAAAAFDMSTLQNSSHTIDVYDFLDGKVPGLEFTSTVGGTLARKAEFRRGKASFYLNGNYIDETEVANIDMSIIAYIKVFSPPGISGPNGSGGAIAIYTKKEIDLNSKDFVPNGLNYKLYSGYVGYKEFYSPNYAEQMAEKINENRKDMRSTLLWNPWIVLDKNNPEAKVIFYNNDVTTSFRLVIEGMDSKGKLVSINSVLQ